MEGVVADGARQVGSEIAGYRIESVLGEGGMGTVYLAERPQGGLCALKVLSARVAAGDPSFATRFRREAAYAEALNHPHILELFEAGAAPDGTLFHAMQYVRGADLGAMLARNGPMGLEQGLSILGQVGDALDCAHAQGLVHRDIKPGNIIVAEEASGAQAFLTDFGLSKNPSEDSVALTRQGQFIGTTAYTAPEEILAQPRGHLVDIYSLGCVLYETLVGAPPFVRERDLDVLYAHIGDPRPKVTDARPDLPATINEIVAKAMAISPTERYGSCAELIAAASALLPGGEGRQAAEMAATAQIAPSMASAPAAEQSAVGVASGGGAGEPAAAPAGGPAPAGSTAPFSEPAPGVPAPTAEPLQIFVNAGAGRGPEIVVDHEVMLGRLSTLDGALADDVRISRRHGRITRSPDGGLLIEDLDSANGTFVNGTRIAGPQRLGTGDEVRIGSTVLLVSAQPALADLPRALEAVPPPAPSAPPTEDPSADDLPQPLPTPEPVVPGTDAPQLQPSPEIGEFSLEPALPSVAKLVLRLEVDLDAGELAVWIEGGEAVRVVRDGADWRMETR
jgi:serine/threonine-protein kinase